MSTEFDSTTEKALAKLAASKPRVLITGGAGYFGSVLVPMLIERGFEVTVLDNLMYGQTTLMDQFYTGKLKFVFGDATNEKQMQALLSKGKFDWIFPLAAVVGFPVSEHKPEYTWMLNHQAVLNLLRERKGARIIFPTTNSGYGTTTGKVQCSEEDELHPLSTYGKSKVAAEKAVAEAGESVSFRLATLFGCSPRMRTDLLVNNFVLRALTDRSIVLYEKDFKRNYLHVRDAARGFLWTMANWEKMKGNTYNLGHPDYNISKDELCKLIQKEVPGLNVFYASVGSDPDKRNYIVSNKKVLATGFEFRYGLEAGIHELVIGYEALRDFRFKNY